MTDEQQTTMRGLDRALPRVAPPVDLFDRVLAELDAPPVRLRRRRPAIAAALLAAAAVIALVAVLVSNGPVTASATATVVSHLPGVSVHGSAALYRPDTSRGIVRLDLRAVPAPPRGHHYEVWVLGAGQTEMTAVGSFTPSSSAVRLRLPLPAPGRYAAVDISVQADGGPAAHSNVSLAGGAFHS